MMNGSEVVQIATNWNGTHQSGRMTGAATAKIVARAVRAGR
jgi:hypothetical protein